MSNWNPKPLRPEDPNPLFKMVDEKPVIKSRTDMERQRDADGTPHTITGRTSLRPPGVRLFVQDDSVEKSTKKQSLNAKENAEEDAVDPEKIVKAYLAQD